MFMSHQSNLSSRRRWPRHLAVFIAMGLLVATAAMAQVQTGNIFGRVVDTSGAALPGVTVTLTGVGAPQTFITDVDGKFRFLNLSPGTWEARAELSGFGSAVRSGIPVNLGRNSDASITMSPTLSDTITVTAETPLLDVRRAGTGATVTQLELQEVPTGRDPWVVMQQVPGVLMDRINVGGSESGQQSSFVGKGVTGDQVAWNVDGVTVTDMASLSSPSYFDFDSFEEMQITTGGSDPRIMTPGVQLNMVTKRGSNEWRGSGRYFLTEDSWQSAADLPEEAESYLLLGNEISQIADYGFEAGGPLIKDRLWAWGAYAYNDIQSFTAQPPDALRYSDDTQLKDYNVKLNAQPTPHNSATAFWTYGNKTKQGRNVGPTRPPETGWNQSGPTDIYKLEDTHIFSPNFYLTLLASSVEAPFQFIPAGGETPVWNDPDGVWHGSYFYYFSDRPQDNYRADMSSFFDTGKVNHELKFGFGYRQTPTTSTSYFPVNNSRTYMFEDGPGAAGGVEFDREGKADFEQTLQDFYVGDTMLMGNLTIQAGFRYDIQNGKNNPVSVRANPIIPDILGAASFTPDTEVEWKTISPRIGATWSPGDTNRTLIRGGYNRYVDQLGGSVLAQSSPFFYYQYLYYYFTDLNGDKIAQRNEIDFDYGIVASYLVDPDNPNSGIPTQRLDPNIRAPKTDELILGVEHALSSEFTIAANYTYREVTDLVWAQPEKNRGAGDFFTPADYEIAGYAEGTVNGQSYRVPYYSVKDGLPSPANFVFTNRPDYKQKYQGIEIALTKRLSNRWMARGNVSFNDWTQDVGARAIYDPTKQLFSGPANIFGCLACNGDQVVQGSGTGSGAKGGIYINSRWSYFMTGMYQGAWGLNYSASVQGREGYPIPFYHRVSSDGTRKSVLALESIEDSPRLDNIFQLDARISREIKVGGVGVTFSVDAFNLTNERTTIQREHRLFTSATRPDPRADQIEELQSPRVFRVGARLSF